MKKATGLALFTSTFLAATYLLGTQSPAPEIRTETPAPISGFFLREIKGDVHQKFHQFLLNETGQRALLWIDSEGGELFAGREILSSVNAWKRQQKGRRLVCNVKTAMSMAFVLVTNACDRVYLLPDSQLMWHAPYKKVEANESIGYGEATQLAKDLKRLNTEMLDWIGPTFRNSDLRQVVRSYVDSRIWTATDFLMTFHPYPSSKYQLVSTFTGLED